METKDYFELVWDGLSKEVILEVFFSGGFVINSPSQKIQLVTTCGIRIKGEVKTYWGNSIQSPKDMLDAGVGRHWAFRRAFIRLLKERWGVPCIGDNFPMPSKHSESRIRYDKFRTKLYEQGAW